MSNIMPALKITDLRKRFGGLPAVDGVNLTIPVGDRRLLLGPNGAGKTTLFNLITGDITPSSGRVELFGEDITGAPSHLCAHRGLARTYQILTLFPNNTLRENVYLALLGLSPLRLNPFRSLKNRADYAERAEQVLQQVGLLALADRKLSETAYGEKRRLEIALALAQKPRLLLLDEPLAGLSREERGDVQALIRAIPSDITVVLIEHDMDIALSLASSITVMYYGQVIAEGDRASITAHPKVREVYFAD